MFGNNLFDCITYYSSGVTHISNYTCLNIWWQDNGIYNKQAGIVEIQGGLQYKAF